MHKCVVGGIVLVLGHLWVGHHKCGGTDASTAGGAAGSG